MKKFELSSEQNKDGLKAFTLIIHEIYDESTFDDATGTANNTNANGSAWREKWVRKNMDTMIGKSIRCEFLNEDRDELHGHGMSGYRREDDIPLFEDATMVGYFTEVEIVDAEENEDGVAKYLVGHGYIDALCYPNLVDKLNEDLAYGEPTEGSVEILRESDKEEITYEYGYHEDQRIPMEYVYSGYAWLGIPPASKQAVLMELNSKEDNQTMDETTVKSVVAEVMSMQAEIEKCKRECEEKVSDANAMVESVTAEKEEISANCKKIQEALNAAQEELKNKYDEIESCYAEIDTLRKALGEAKAKERIGEMNAAIAEFSETEREYAKAEIEAFETDPMACEINSIVSKIYEGIGKTARETAAKVTAEQNSAKDDSADIFCEVIMSGSVDADASIF